MTAPTAEAFLASNEPDEDDVESFTGVLVDTADLALGSIATSLRMIADTLARPIAARDAEAADAHGEELRLLGEAYDDLEAKHRSLYDLLAEVEKIVAKSKSQVSLEVKAAINAWRNPTVDEAAPEQPVEPEPGSVVIEPSEPVYTPMDGGEPAPAADAPIEIWRAYAHGRGVEGADVMNRSQIRTALGLSHFEG